MTINLHPVFRIILSVFKAMVVGVFTFLLSYLLVGFVCGVVCMLVLLDVHALTDIFSVLPSSSVVITCTRIYTFVVSSFLTVYLGVSSFLVFLEEERHKRAKQLTWIYCECGNELHSSGSFVSDTYDENGDNHVKYRCSRCRKEYDYNFDIAPIPVGWDELESKQR